MSETTVQVSDADIPPRIRQAVAALDRDRVAEAEDLLSAILADNPDEAAALQLLGLVRRRQGNDAQAEALYRRSLSIEPAQPQVRHNLGNLLKIAGRDEEAAAEYREAIRLKPNYAEAHLSLALVLSEMGDHDAAAKSCREALRIQPNFLLAKQTLAAELCSLGEPKQAERLLRQAIAIGVRNPRQMAAIEHNLGVALKLQHRYPEALSAFESACARVPELAAANYNRGNILQHLGRFEEAIEAYRTAVAQNPLDLAAHRDLNGLLYRLGDDESFLKSFDEAAALYPEFAPLPLQKGNFLYLKGDLLRAREAFERAVRLAPDAVSPHDGLALVLAQLGDFAPALIEHQRALRTAPDSSPVWRNYAQTLLAAGDAKAALAASERAVALEPDSQIALAIWGLALRVLEDPREQRMNDVESLVRVYEVGLPEGYSSLADFNCDLNLYLDRLHRDRRECIDQTLRSGTQTLENLFGAGHAPVEKLRARIDEAVADYVSRMGDDDAHPLFRRRRPDFAYSASWSSRLYDCGFHTNHVHPKGWISSAYYVCLPEAVENGDEKQGWIKFGEPNVPFGIESSVRRAVKPEPGLLVLFPSYMWHGTIPFRSTRSRTTIAFDVVPGAPR